MATTLVLLGRTGNGKSSTGNSILGRNAFKSAFGFGSVTQDCHLETACINGRTVNVIDTPGLFDSNVSNDNVAKKIVKCIELAKYGLHGVLMVISIKTRYTPEEAQVLDILQILFGPNIINYMVVVFTGGDMIEKGKLQLEDFFNQCPPPLKELLHRCNNRMIIFNNKAKPEKQKEKVKELQVIIDKIIYENGGQPYSNEIFQGFQSLSKQLLSLNGRPGSYSTEDMTQALTKATCEVEERLQKAMTKLEEQIAAERNARIIAETQLQDIRNRPPPSPVVVVKGGRPGCRGRPICAGLTPAAPPRPTCSIM